MNLIEQLKQIPVPHRTRGKCYPFWQVLPLALLGSLCYLLRDLRDRQSDKLVTAHHWGIQRAVESTV